VRQCGRCRWLIFSKRIRVLATGIQPCSPSRARSFPRSLSSHTAYFSLTPSHDLFSLSYELRNYLLFRNSLISFCVLSALISMASTCYPPIAQNDSYKSVFVLGTQCWIPPTFSDAQPFNFTACFAPSMEDPAPMDDHQLQPAPPMGDLLLSARTANLLDNERFPFLGQYLPHPEPVVDLTLDEDGDVHHRE
jgi:hypothetical protein